MAHGVLIIRMYEEVMAAFPEAKFLLTISEPETWLSERFGGLSAGFFLDIS